MPDSLRDLRRQQIITAARTLVSTGGLEALTISRLEKELEFSRGVITYHFEGKDEIVEAVLDSALEEIHQAASAGVASAADLGDKIRAMLRGMVAGFVERREATQILVSFWARIPNDEHVTKLNAQLYRTYRSESARVLGRAKKDGLTRITPKQIDALAGLLVGIVIGIATQVHFEPGSVNPDAMIEIAAKAIEQHIG